MEVCAKLYADEARDVFAEEREHGLVFVKVCFRGRLVELIIHSVNLLLCSVVNLVPQSP